MSTHPSNYSWLTASHCNQILTFYRILWEQSSWRDNHVIGEDWGGPWKVSSPGDHLQEQPSLVNPHPPRTTTYSCPDYTLHKSTQLGAKWLKCSLKSLAKLSSTKQVSHSEDPGPAHTLPEVWVQPSSRVHSLMANELFLWKQMWYEGKICTLVLVLSVA